MRSRSADGIQMVFGNRGRRPKEIGTMEVERDPGAMARTTGVEVQDPEVGQEEEKESFPKVEKVEKEEKASMVRAKEKASGTISLMEAR